MTNDEKKSIIQAISDSFFGSIEADKKIQKIITEGASTSEEVARLAKLLGAHLRSAVAQNFMDVELLEGEAMSELAKEILEPLMKYSHTLIGRASMDVVAIFNARNGISITPKLPDFPKARFEQIISAAGEEGKLRETILRRISVVPETVVTNMSDYNAKAVVKTYSSAGFETYIHRSDGAGCCEWCSKLVGKFEYPEKTPKDVFRRHDNCGCIVTYVCGNLRQNVHSKETWEQPDVKENELVKNPKVEVAELTKNPKVEVAELVRNPLTDGEESDRIKEKEAIISAFKELKNSDEIIDKVIENHLGLSLFTPLSMKIMLESFGYTTKPLTKSSTWKGIPFEQGGGYKINFGGDAYFQYHPEGGSHHDGAYWRISNGKRGDNRYNMDGTVWVRK